MVTLESILKVEDKEMSLHDLVGALAESAVFEALTEHLDYMSEEEKETAFATEYLYSVDNGDVYYNEVAQDLYGFYHDYYEHVFLTLFGNKE